MPNPWDRSPQPDKGELSAEDIFVSVGRALSAWENLEAALGDFFAFIVGAGFGLTDPALRAYGSVSSFANRATMLEEAAAAYFHDNPNSHFKERFRQVITVECRGFSGRRNQIAHGRVQGAFNKSGGIGMYLMPSLYATKNAPAFPGKHHAPVSTPVVRHSIRCN